MQFEDALVPDYLRQFWLTSERADFV